MVFRLLMFALWYLAPLLGAGYLGYRTIVRPRLTERRLRRQALLQESHDCGNCNDYVDPTARDARFMNGRWYHKRCLRLLLGN